MVLLFLIFIVDTEFHSLLVDNEKNYSATLQCYNLDVIVVNTCTHVFFHFYSNVYNINIYQYNSRNNIEYFF